MKIILPKSQILAAFLFSVFMQTTAFGATITSTGTGGNWNSGSSWVGGIIPTAADDVVIASTSTVTITADAAAKSISVSGILMVNDGVVFTVGSSTTSGNFTVNSGGNFSTANGSGLSTVIVYGNYINNGTTDFWKSTVIIVGDLLSPATSELQKQGNVVVGGNIIGDFNLTGGNGTGQIYAVNPNATVTITPVSIDNNVPPGTTVNNPPETQVLVDLVNLVLYGICPYTVSGTLNAIVCTSTPTASFTVATSGSSPSYQWQVNAGSGWTDLTNAAPYSGVATNTLTVTISGTGLSGNKYRAKITSGGCTKNGDYGTLTITSVAPSTPGNITGTTPQCPSNSGEIYTIAAVSGATSYTWTVPSGWTINSGNGTTSIFVTTGLVGNDGNVTVTASNGCGTSAPKNFAVTVITSTITGAGTVGGSASYCSFTNNTTLTLSGTSLPIGNGAGKANVIRWESSVDDFITNTVIANITTTLTITDLSFTTKFRAIVLANSGGCPEDSAPATITVNPTPTLTSATQTIFACDNSAATIKLTGLLAGSTSTVNYTINGVAQTAIANLTAVAGEASFVTRNLTAADNGKLLQITGITTTSASPSCTKSFAGIAGIDVTLNVKPNSGDISLNSGTPIASGGTTTFSEKTTATFSIAAVPGATGYTWVVPTGWSITSGQGTTQITVTTGTEFQSGNVTVTAINMFCPSSLGVTLTSIAPAAPVPNTVIPVKCTTLGSISFNNLPAGSWTLTVIKGGVSIGSIIGSGSTWTVGSLSTGTYTFTVTDTYGTSVASAPVLIDVVTMTWNGSGWFIGSSPSATAPTLDDIVEFSGNYTGPDSINACSCTVKTGAAVTIASTKVLTVVNGVDVQAGGTLTFASGASLIQNNVRKDLNTGNIIYKRTVSPIKDFDYVYWSSPVAGQTLGLLSPQSDKYWSWLIDNWTAASGAVTMIEGKGYIARVPRYVTSQTVNFIGVPNNGTVTIATQGVNKSNLIGNPYPSAIDAKKFLNDNVAVIPAGSMLSFWTHNSARALNTAGTQYEYASADYASYTLSGGVKADSGGVAPDGTIAAGQSFFVGSGIVGSFIFTNSMRIGDEGKNSLFFKQTNTKKTTEIEQNRIWLNLTNSGGAYKQLLIGYITGATNDEDKLYDGVTRNGNPYVDFYSINNSKNYTIQGRGLPFDKTDEVPLGYKSTIAGTFQIGIDNVDGSMVNQAIYLEDKMTNTIHDLKTGAYSFTTVTGVFNDRFVLRYTNTSKLGTGDVETKGKGFFVSVRNREIKINSFDQTLTSVKVYDLKGSLLYEKNKVNKNEFIIDTLNVSNQFMIVMVQLEDGKWISEEIIFHD